MTSITAYDNDIRAIAHAHIERCEEGAFDYPAFVAAVNAYRKHRPEGDEGEAALTFGNLLQEMPRAGCR